MTPQGLCEIYKKERQQNGTLIHKVPPKQHKTKFNIGYKNVQSFEY